MATVYNIIGITHTHPIYRYEPHEHAEYIFNKYLKLDIILQYCMDPATGYLGLTHIFKNLQLLLSLVRQPKNMILLHQLTSKCLMHKLQAM